MVDKLMAERVPVFNFQLWVRTMINGTMLLDEQAKKKYFINITGSFILSKCDGRHSIEDIVQSVCDNFSAVMKADAWDDVLETLEKFNKSRIICFHLKKEMAKELNYYEITKREK